MQWRKHTETPTRATRREKPLRSQLSHPRWHQQGSDGSLLGWAVNQESVIRYLTNNSYECCAHTHIEEYRNFSLCLYSSVNDHIIKHLLISKDPPSARTRTRSCHCCASKTFKVRHCGRDPWGQNITPRHCWNLKQMSAVVFLAHCYQITLSPAGLTSCICPTHDKLEMK